MPTNAKPKSKRATVRQTKRSPSAAPGSAIALLKADHREVEDFFEEYEDLVDDDAKVTVLGEQIKHHVKEEEEEIFPEVEDLEMDVIAIGARMAARKKELMMKAGMVPAEYDIFNKRTY